MHRLPTGSGRERETLIHTVPQQKPRDAGRPNVATMSDAIDPFRLNVPESELDDLRQRLSRTRWPERETVGDWSQGVPLAKLRALCEYWRTAYDWRRCETTLNGLGQSRTTIDGLGIHFLHVRSPEADALPVVMTHGWPGSVVEFLKVIGPLTDPAAHGGDRRDAFHLVLPTLPGFGFSDKPAAAGWGLERTAAAWATLMHRLGYGKRWAAQGGDWGAGVTWAIGLARPSGCVGIGLNMLPIKVTPQERAEAVGDATEQSALAALERYDKELSGYSKEQSTRPQTIGYALADSPAGQAAWTYEKFHDWTDNAGSPEDVLGIDEMLDNVMLYWLPNAAASSARLYWESFQSMHEKRPPCTLATAISMFPKELQRGSRRWAERRFPNLVHWNELDRGGHFAAFEQPAMFTAEVRAGFRSMR